MRVILPLSFLLITVSACSIPSRTIDDSTSMRSFDAINHDLADERVTVAFTDGRTEVGLLGSMDREEAHFYELGDQYNITMPTSDIAAIKERQGFPLFSYLGGAVAIGGLGMQVGLLPEVFEDGSVLLNNYTVMTTGIAVMIIGYRINQPSVIYEIDHDQL